MDRSEKKPASNGFSIISRCPNSNDESEKQGTNLAVVEDTERPEQKRLPVRIVHDSTNSAPKRKSVSSDLVPRTLFVESTDEQPSSTTDNLSEGLAAPSKRCDRQQSNGIQCSKVTSSDSECDSPSPPPLPERQAMGHRPSFRYCRFIKWKRRRELKFLAFKLAEMIDSLHPQVRCWAPNREGLGLRQVISEIINA